MRAAFWRELAASGDHEHLSARLVDVAVEKLIAPDAAMIEAGTKAMAGGPVAVWRAMLERVDP